MLVGVVIQARMSSQRLPGKVLQPLAGKPMLEYLVERLQHRLSHLPLVVATSRVPSDDPLASYCHTHGLRCFRGDLENVASRFLAVAREHALDAFVRVNGDSPLLDPALIEHAIALLREHGCDLVTNTFPRSYPPGQSVEVVRTDAFCAAFAAMSTLAEHEHVTRYFYKHPGRWKIHNFGTAADHAGIHLAVDTNADLEHVAGVLEAMHRPHWEYTVAEVVQLYRALHHTRREAA